MALRGMRWVLQVPGTTTVPHLAQRWPQPAGTLGLCRAGGLCNLLSAASSSTGVCSQVSPQSETQESS